MKKAAPRRGRSDCQKSQNPSPSADMRRRRRHRQENFAANCVRGAVLRVRDLTQNFVEGVFKRGNRRVRRSRARLLPLLQRVEFLDTLKRPRAGAALRFIMERCSQCAFGPAFVIAQRPGQRVQQRTVNLAAAGNKAVLHFLGCQRVRHDQLQAENIGQPFVPD